MHTFNPKCIKMGELYGEYNLLTNEWTDGLGSTLIRDAVVDTSPDKKFICFDGPVDAIWIENMNTVLDDNCTLCLPNGERIKLNPNTMRMLFEVQDLSVASPATVSRCGMVYVPAEELGWRPFVQTWIATDLESDLIQDYRCCLSAPVQKTMRQIVLNRVENACWPLQGIRSRALRHVLCLKITCASCQSLMLLPGFGALRLQACAWCRPCHSCGLREPKTTRSSSSPLSPLPCAAESATFGPVMVQDLVTQSLASSPSASRRQAGWDIQSWSGPSAGQAASSEPTPALTLPRAWRRDLIWKLFDTYVDPILKWVRKHGRELIPSVDNNLTATTARIMQSLLHPRRGFKLSVRRRDRECLGSESSPSADTCGCQPLPASCLKRRRAL